MKYKAYEEHLTRFSLPILVCIVSSYYIVKGTIIINDVHVWPDYDVQQNILSIGHPQEELIFR